MSTIGIYLRLAIRYSSLDVCFPLAYSSKLIPQAGPGFTISPSGGNYQWLSMGSPGHYGFSFEVIGISITASIVILIIGLALFRRLERSFADVI